MSTAPPSIDLGKPAPQLDRRHVLIAEDDVYIARGLAVALGTEFDVSLRASANDFARSFELIRPDVMLVDYRLPDMNGVDLLSMLRREHGSEVPAVMVSAHVHRAHAALSAGFDEFLAKPFGGRELIRALHRAMSRD